MMIHEARACLREVEANHSKRPKRGLVSAFAIRFGCENANGSTSDLHANLQFLAGAIQRVRVNVVHERMQQDAVDHKKKINKCSGLGRSVCHPRSMLSNISSFELSAIFAWCPSRHLAKCDTERADLRVTHGQCDIRHRFRTIRQQYLGALNASLHMVLMRRNSERLLERPTEMMLAQANQSRKHDEADLIAQVLFDVVDDSTFLPAGETAAIYRRDGYGIVLGAR